MELHSQLLSGFSAPTTQWLIHNQVCVCGCISVSALGKSKSADAITNPQQLHLQIFLPAADPVTIQCCERACVRARMPLLIITYKMSFSFHLLRKLKHKNSVVENRPLDVYALRRFWRHKGKKKSSKCPDTRAFCTQRTNCSRDTILTSYIQTELQIFFQLFKEDGFISLFRLD